MSLQSESFIARRTESLDAEKIAQLVTNHTEAVFGRTDVECIIEHANLSITLVGVESDEVLGHMALFDYPRVEAVDQAQWEEWIHTNYECKKTSPLNSLFIHLFVAKEGFLQGANAELLRATFMAVPLLQHVFLTTPASTNLGSALSNHMSIVLSLNDDPSTDLYIAHRFEHFPMLHVRPSEVEDADDLMPIFSQYSKDVNEQYGEFFLAEMIESQDDDHKTIVADVGGHAVGFLSVTTQVDVDLLYTCHQLESFHGLKHPLDGDETHSVSTLGTKLGSTLTMISSSLKSTCADSEDNDIPSQSSFPVAPPPQQDGESLGSSTSRNPSAVMVDGKEAKVGSSSSLSQHASTVVMEEEMQERRSAADLAIKSNVSKGDKIPVQEDVPVVVPTTTTGDKKPRKKQQIFKGRSNALAVQLFAIDDKYETRSIDLLPMVFQLFPDYDFLILSQPHSYPEFPLLNHFTRVPPRSGATISQELYVLHKCGLLHSFSVSHATSPDVPGIVKMCADLNGGSDLIEDVERYIQAKRDPLSEGGKPISALVAKCSNQIVGVAVLRDEQDIRYIRSHYNIEDFIYFDYHDPTGHAHLHHFMLNPVFASYAKHFIKECLRLSYKSCLYYPMYPDMEIQTGRPHSIITALSHMIPIKPRHQIMYRKDHVDINTPLDDVLKMKAPFALYHTNTKLTLEPKMTINSRVVVVGASDTSISLLETLIFNPHLYFTNLTLVSPHNFSPPPTSTSSDDFTPSKCSQFHVTSSSLCFTQEQYNLLGLHTWVNFIKETMTAINRPDQYVVVESGELCTCSLVHYDYLILCTGTQYQVPSLNKRPVPRHVFTVNNSHETNYLLEWVKNKFNHSRPDFLIVYGNNLDTYCVLQAMIDSGIPPTKLLLASPDLTRCCTDPVVLKRLDEAVTSAGVRVIGDVSLKEWVTEGDKLTGVWFQSSTSKVMEISCQALVYVDEKHVDKQAFEAMNDACLIFDKRLVITANHGTNDPFILAAGPLTKFSRRYRAERWTHANFNSHEVGERLAKTMLSKLDPTVDPNDNQRTDPNLLPTYTQCKAVSAYLPDGYHFLHIHSPRVEGEIIGPQYHNHQLSTDTENGYMCLNVNRYGKVDEIVTLTLQPLLDRSNYFCLYNTHEKYLNNMLQRYKDDVIPDLFVFFREPWAYAIFYDRFKDFLDEILEQMTTLSIKDESGESDSEIMYDYVRALVEDDPQIFPASHRKDLLSLFNASSTKLLVEKKLYKYLQYNTHHLPMFAKPDMI